MTPSCWIYLIALERTVRNFNPWRSWFAHGFAWLITLGNISFPLAVLLRWVK